MALPALNSDPKYWSSRVEVGCALQIFRIIHFATIEMLLVHTTLDIARGRYNIYEHMYAELAHPEVLSDGPAYAACRLLNLALSSHAPALYILARRCQNILRKFKGGKGQGYGTPLPPRDELVAEIVARAAAASGWTWEEGRILRGLRRMEVKLHDPVRC